jgi:hypothetical protein
VWLTVLLLSLPHPPALACRGPFPTWDVALAGAERVFQGTVTAVGDAQQVPGDPFGVVPLTFRVTRVWRGPVSQTVVIRTGNHTCGLRAEVGQQWVILAAGNPPGTGATSLDVLLTFADGRRTEHSTRPVEQALGQGTRVP